VAVRTWAAWALRRRVEESLVTEARAARLETLVVAGLHVWRDCAARRAANRATIGLALARMGNAKLRAACLQWRARAAGDAARRREAVAAALARAAARRLRAAWAHLRLAGVLRRARRMALATVLARLALQRWARATWTAALREAALCRVAVTAAERRAQRGVAAWRDYAGRRRAAGAAAAARAARAATRRRAEEAAAAAAEAARLAPGALPRWAHPGRTPLHLHDRQGPSSLPAGFVRAGAGGVAGGGAERSPSAGTASPEFASAARVRGIDGAVRSASAGVARAGSSGSPRSGEASPRPGFSAPPARPRW